MLLEVTFGKLYAWAIQNVRNILLDANAKFKELGESHLVAVFCGENCFTSILLLFSFFFKFPIIRMLESVPLICVENYFVSVCCSNLPTLTPH